ncbi:Crp/Fnr family transcriptional regulator [Marivita lacus]|uniref:Crp/Fnr family transcriptional regulator n=1 Tax=Marivita lacus TaxID=1323742 RepID=A0ABQ1KKL6_9RHOB|nr:Crp/Fnr family transcriptional regulator [Marivita lacus]GGC00563.1 Crp/Fnr family transcriptional regulator [Marivita lacus]
MSDSLANAVSQELADVARIWPDCDTTARTVLRGLADEHGFSRPVGHITKFEGDDATAIYLVKSGWLLVSKSLEDGQRQIIDIVLAGQFLDPGSADCSVSAFEVQALTDIEVAVIPRDAWERAAQKNAELHRLFHTDLRSALSRMSERMLRLGKGTAENIIAYALFELCLRSTRKNMVEGVMFHIPMTQQQLGDFCGLSAVHICRTLRRFSRIGLLDVTDHMNIVVRDVDSLAEIAEIDPADLRQEIVPAI